MSPPSLPQAEEAQFPQLLLKGKCSHPRSSLWLFTQPTPVHQHLSFTGEPQMGYIILDVLQGVLSRGWLLCYSVVYWNRLFQLLNCPVSSLMFQLDFNFVDNIF